MMMKINSLYMLVFALLFSTQANAQITAGGTPPSFNNSMKNTYENVYLEAVSEEWKTEHEAEASKNGSVDPISKNITTNINLLNSGTWETKKNGDRIWRLKINAENAQGINTYFKDFFLPEGAKLFLYNNDKTQVIGAFTTQNNHESGLFATEIIFGNSLTIEYYEPRGVVGQGSFTVEKVGSFFKDIIHSQAKSYGDSDPCEVNINCSEGNDWQDEKNGVARILVTSSSGSGWCSGSLVNNTNGDCKPYFLTAYHCGNSSTTSDFLQWVFYFNYEYNSCGSTSSNTSEPSPNTMTGSSVRARANDLTSTSTSSDFLLLELSNNVPSSYNPYYNGWDATGAVPSSGVSIHHPAGDVMKISTFTSTPTNKGISWNGNSYSVGFGVTHWSFSWASTTNGHGVTEGGSSGSPLFNAQGLVIGDLSGGSSGCSNLNADDQYGKMSYHWTSNSSSSARQLKPWLDPTNSGTLTLNGTYSPCSSSVLIDAELVDFQSPGTNSCDFNVAPAVTLKNNGNVSLVSAVISYQLNNGGTISTTWTGNLTQNKTEIVYLNTTTTSVTSNTISATVSNPNALLDGNTSNDNISLNFQAGVSNALPFLERADVNPPTNNIEVINNDDDVTWAYSGLGSYGTSPNSFYIDNWDYEAYNEYDWLITESYDFTDAVNEELYFDLAYTYYQQTNGTNISYDSLGIAVSTDCGENFYWLWKEGGTQLATVAGGLGDEFIPQNDEWQTRTIDLAELNGEDNVTFAFIAINGYGNNLYLDNIGIGKVLLSVDKTETWGSDISIYPNPTNSVINLNSSINNLNYKIVNNIGQEMSNGNLNTTQKTIDVSLLNKGIYFLEVYSLEGNKLMKFIKN